MELENTTSVIQDFVFLCPKVTSRQGYILSVYNKELYIPTAPNDLIPISKD